MEAGRQRASETRMKGCVNFDNKMTDIYLPRKCDYTDRIITSKDHSSIQLSVCDVHPILFQVNADGTINLAKSNIINISGFVRSTGQGDAALQKILNEKKLL
jgi:small subunit ribosomal protein S21e